MTRVRGQLQGLPGALALALLPRLPARRGSPLPSRIRKLAP